MSQRQQLERLIEIDRQIRAGLYPNARKLADQLEVSRRVIYMDREFLVERLGAPLAYDRDHDGWYYTEPTFVLPTALVTEGELLAFFLSVEVAQRYLGSAWEAPLRSAVAKICRGMKGPVEVDLEALRSQYTFAASPVASSNKQTLLDLYHAIRERRKVKIDYYSANRGKQTQRIVDPYHLYNIRGDWYLIAFDSLRHEVRNFHAGRIKSWEVLDSRFEQQKDFSPKKWMASALLAERGGRPVRIAIRFDSYQARWIRERVWHESQRIEEQPDSGLVLHLRTALTGELQRWILQFGSHAEVLKPRILRVRIFSELSGLTKAYKKEKPEQAS